MKRTPLMAGTGLVFALVSLSAFAGVVDPNCTPEKAAKSAAARTTRPPKRPRTL